MVYITGDCHADWSRFAKRYFRAGDEMTAEDFVIVCGDFGIWHDTKEERWNLDWLAKKPYNILFVDGNHENFDRLYSDEFPVVEFHGGMAHKIRENVYHLMRGYIFELCGKTFFAFGGASSHDIQDGILDRKDYKSNHEFNKVYRDWYESGKMFRVNHESWWEQEMPSDEEIAHGLMTLKDHGNKVDYIITHCGPQQEVSMYSHGYYTPDKLTSYLNMISNVVTFDKWFFGHYHEDLRILDKYEMLYHQMIRIV